MNEKGQTDKEKYEDGSQNINLEDENGPEEPSGEQAEVLEGEGESEEMDLEKLTQLAREKICPDCPEKQEQEKHLLHASCYPD